MSTSSDLSAFGLRSPPFSKEIDDADLWLPESKTALVADIEASLAERQSVLLLGEPGVGKTCVLRALRRNLPQAGFRLTYCRNATLGRRDFYRYLCHALGLHPTSTAANLFLAVETHVQDLRRDKAHPVFLLDEAHLLHPDMMAHLHILLNHEWDAKALLSLVLIGLPELEPNLSRRAACGRSHPGAAAPCTPGTARRQPGGSPPRPAPPATRRTRAPDRDRPAWSTSGLDTRRGAPSDELHQVL